MNRNEKRIKLSSEIKFNDIPRFRFYGGIFIGLGSAVLIYFGSYMVRETFRVLSITENHDLWILSDEKVNFSNLFLAFISFIFAQSICINFWLNSPRSLGKRQNLRKTTILNDQGVLNISFLHWFAKLVVVLGIAFGPGFHMGCNTLSLYPEYNYIFILIIIVLFLQTWNTIRITFKRNSLNRMLSAALIISVLSFGLSKVNPIDYKLLNEVLLENCVVCKYDIKLPKAKHFKKDENRELIENIYLVNDETYNSKMIIDNEIVSVDTINRMIKKFQKLRDPAEVPLMKFKLIIDERVEMKLVNKLKAKLANVGAFKISYGVIPDDNKFSRGFYFDNSINTRIHSGYIEKINFENFEPHPPFSLEHLFKNKSKVILKINETNFITVNDTIVERFNLESQVSKYIIENGKYHFIIKMNNNDTFSDFFVMWNSCRNAIIKKRNDYSMKIFAESFDNLSENKQDKIKNALPFRVTEITDEMIKTKNVD